MSWPPRILPEPVRLVRCVLAALAAISVHAEVAAGRPIPRGPDARTQRDYNRMKFAWMVRNTVRAYEKSSGSTGPRREAEARFLGNVCRFVCRQEDAPAADALAKEAKALLKAGSSDPLVLAWCGNVLHTSHEAEEAEPPLRNGLAGLAKSRYPKVHAFFAARSLGMLLFDKARTRREAERWRDVALDSMAAAVRAGEFAQGAEQIAYRLLDDASRRPFTIDRWATVRKALGRAGDTDPWLMRMLEGSAALEDAFEFRGGSAAPKFDSREWKIFGEKLKRAETALRRAWELEHARPEPAHEMILVSMISGSKERKEHLWFDRAVEAQIDHGPAYSRYIASLQPGWGGSDKAMRDFGLECIATGRFDTSVPVWYLCAMKLIVFHAPYQSPPRRTPYMSKGVRENVRRIFEGMLGDPAWAGERDRILTRYALNAAWYGDHARAKELMGRVKGDVDLTDDPWGREFRWSRRYRDVLEAETRAYTGPARELLERADSLDSGRAAWPVFEKAMEACADDREVRSYLLDRMVHARMGHRPSELRIDRTALRHAAEAGNLREAVFLLKSGAAVDPRDDIGSTPLAWAAKNGHTAVCRELLARGAAIDSENNVRWTALHFALKNGHAETARFLVEKGADVNVPERAYWEPIHLAVGNCPPEVAALLLDKGARVDAGTDKGLTPLHHAAFRGKLEHVRLLLGRGASVDLVTLEDKATPLHYAAGHGTAEMVRLMLDKQASVTAVDTYGWTPLHCAAKKGSPEMVRLLIAKGCHLDAKSSQGWTALHHAARYARPVIVRLLLEKGAKVEVKGNDGWTPLILAARNCDAGTVRLLVDKGADVSASTGSGSTPLWQAARKGSVESVALLLARGARVGAKDKEGWTPLHVAARYHPAPIARLLLEKGAEVNARNANSWTPLHHATSYGDIELVRLLLDRGADINARQKYRWTPLHLAAKKAAPEVVKLLLDRGANVFAEATKRRTPLHMAGERKESKRVVVEMIRRHIEKMRRPPEADEDVF